MNMIIVIIMTMNMISRIYCHHPISEELAKRFPLQLQSIAAGGSALKLKYDDDDHDEDDGE